MKIVFILPQEATQPIGGFKVVYEYANALSRRNHRVHIVHTATALPKATLKGLRAKTHALRYFSFAIRGNWKPDSWFQLDPSVKISWIPWISKRFLPEADVYVATWWCTAEHLDAIRNLKGRRFYLIQHLETWSGPEEQVMATWKMPFEKIVIARWLQDIASKLGEPSHYIPNGLDFDRFGCDLPPQHRDPKRLAMLFNDRIEWKGSSDGLAAAYLLKSRYPDLKAELFGVCERPTNLPEWITYHRDPQQEKLRRIYNRASIFLAPSHSEGWGLPPSEAMTCGAAIVATDVGGHREFCVDGENALLVPIKNPEAMAAAATCLIENNNMRIDLAMNGCASIRRFTWKAATDTLESILLRPAHSYDKSSSLDSDSILNTAPSTMLEPFFKDEVINR